MIEWLAWLITPIRRITKPRKCIRHFSDGSFADEPCVYCHCDGPEYGYKQPGYFDPDDKEMRAKLENKSAARREARKTEDAEYAKRHALEKDVLLPELRQSPFANWCL